MKNKRLVDDNGLVILLLSTRGEMTLAWSYSHSPLEMRLAWS